MLSGCLLWHGVRGGSSIAVLFPFSGLLLPLCLRNVVCPPGFPLSSPSFSLTAVGWKSIHGYYRFSVAELRSLGVIAGVLVVADDSEVLVEPDPGKILHAELSSNPYPREVRINPPS